MLIATKIPAAIVIDTARAIFGSLLNYSRQGRIVRRSQLDRQMGELPVEGSGERFTQAGSVSTQTDMVLLHTLRQTQAVTRA